MDIAALCYKRMVVKGGEFTIPQTWDVTLNRSAAPQAVKRSFYLRSEQNPG